MSNKHGKIAEEYFSRLLHSNGIEFRFVDDWYDYLVSKSRQPEPEPVDADAVGSSWIKVELKSCRLSIRGTIKEKGKKIKEYYRIGQFDFTSEENRERLKAENVWVALVVRHNRDCLFYGFVRASEFNGHRYVTLHSLRDKNVVNFNDWCQLEGIKRKNRPCPYCGREMILG